MLFQELSKLKRSSIMASIILMAVGILMIMCPEAYISSLVSVLGSGLLIFATVMVLDFISSKKNLMNHIYLTLALILGLIGTAIQIFDTNVMRVIGFLFGAWLIFIGIHDIINAMVYARRARRETWVTLVVLSVLLVICGIIVLVNPWWDEPVKLFDIIGVMLLFSSLVSIVRGIMVWPVKSE